MSRAENDQRTTSREIAMRTCIQTALILTLAAFGCTKPSAAPTQAAQSSGGKAPAQAPKDPTAPERAKLVGTWAPTDGEFQGIRMEPAALKEMKWTFTNDKVSFSMLGRAVEATYTLQPNATPKTFDFKGPDTAIQGIYELNGDTLKVCYAATERPKSFATGGTAQDTIMTVFKKAK
jgi:uncharacterized protein (TIGR03067 family)